MILLCFFFVVVFIIIIYMVLRKHPDPLLKSFHEIPCPGAIPVLGNITDIFYNDVQIWKITRKRSLEHYPIYRSKMFNKNIVCLLHPEDIELILGSTKHNEKSFIYETMKKLTGNGLLVNKGESWRKKRKFLTKNFHFSALQDYISIFNREVHILVNQLQKHVNQSIHILDPITKSALKIIIEIIVGENLKLSKSEINDYVSALETISEIVGYKELKPVINLVYNHSHLKKREEKALNVMHSFSSRVLQYSKLETTPGDTARIMDLLINAEGLYDEQGIRDEIDTFIFAGNSTISVGLLFALLVLANYPKYQDEIYEEIVQTVELSKPPSYADLRSMNLLDRFLKECMRLYPPAPLLGRIISEDIITKTGYRIPAGTSVVIQLFDIHRNPNNFENPDKFDPDRFLPENIASRHPFSYIPFSAGPRNCIAQKFAVLEMKASICGILKKFKLQPVDSIEDMEFVPDLTLKTKQSIRVKLISR